MNYLSSNVAIVADENNPCIHIALKSLIMQEKRLTFLGVYNNSDGIIDLLLRSNLLACIVLRDFPLADINKMLGYGKDCIFYLSSSKISKRNNSFKYFDTRNPAKLIDSLVQLVKDREKYENITFSIKSSPKYIESVSFVREDFEEQDIKILNYLCSGYSLNEIVDFLDLTSLSALRRCLYSLRDRLGVRDISELIVCAFRSGLVS